MISVSEVLHSVELLAPPSYALDSDNIGLLVGDPAESVTGIGVCLDASIPVLEAAKALGLNLIVAHHPIIWNALKSITPNVPNGPALLFLLRNQMSLMAAHTNWDCAEHGINHALLEQLGFSPDPEHFPGPPVESKLVFFAPTESVAGLLTVLSESGAGRIGSYSHCSFQIPGTGTFFGHKGTEPTVGRAGELTYTPEVRVEMVVPAKSQKQVLSALKQHHPYEEPAFDLLPLISEKAPVVRTASRGEPTEIAEFWREIEVKLGGPAMAWTGGNHLVKRVGVVGGAGGGYWRQAKAAGCDTFISGEIPHHEVIEATRAGIHMIQAGHFATENPGMKRLATKLNARFPKLPVHFLEPSPGDAGRPLI